MRLTDRRKRLFLGEIARHGIRAARAASTRARLK
jgi:hypothetical protein